ncbi:MAG: MFS transporter [Planctomycetota bacterium]
MSNQITPSGSFAVLRNNSDIRRIWAAQIVSELGDWLTRIAVIAYVANATGQTALSIAIVQALMLAPYFFVSPFAGVLADKLPRRSVMFWVDAIAAVVVLSYLWVFSVPATGFALWALSIIVTVHLSLAAVFEASRTSLIAAVAKPHELAGANALSQTTWSVCLALGSALGGFLVSKFGTNTAVVIDSLTFMAGCCIILTIRGGRAAAATQAVAHDSGSLRDAILYLRARPTIVALLVPKLVLGLVGINEITFALIGPRLFGVGAEHGLFQYYVAVGIGTLLGQPIGFALARGNPAKMRIGIGIAFLFESAIFSLTLISNSLSMIVAVAGLATAGGSVIWTFSCTLLQRSTPDRVTGRAIALDLGFFTMTVAASIIAGGFLYDYFNLGVRLMLGVATGIYAFGGIVWFAVMYAFRGRIWEGDAGRPES